MPTQNSKRNNNKSRMVNFRLPHKYDGIILEIAKKADPNGSFGLYDPQKQTVNEAAVIRYSLNEKAAELGVLSEVSTKE